MNERELRKYLGLPEGRLIDPDIIEGMKDVPFPLDMVGHTEAYKTFLSVASPVAMRKKHELGKKEQ